MISMPGLFFMSVIAIFIIIKGITSITYYIYIDCFIVFKRIMMGYQEMGKMVPIFDVSEIRVQESG